MNQEAPMLGNLPKSVFQQSVVSVLAVLMRESDHENLRAIFNHTNWQLSGVSCCKDALEKLSQNQVGVVICDLELADGGWKSILDEIGKLSNPPLLIVASPNDDVRMWAEVLNLGAYDATIKPFDKDEVIRIISLGWLHWRDQRMPPARQKQPKVERGRLGAA